MRVRLFGFEFDDLSYDQAVARVLGLIRSDRFHFIVTMNPEILLAALDRPEYGQVVRQASLIFADGTGLILANRFLNGSALHKITGSDLTPLLLGQPGLSCYFLGARPEVVLAAVATVRAVYPGLRIVGYRDGYFRADEEDGIIDEIERLRPDVVFTALGAPKQEFFLNRLRERLDHGVGIGIGGVFDILSGSKQRAPVWIQKMGLEWLYRGLIEPKRMKRWGFIPVFFWRVVLAKLSIPYR